MIYTEFFVKGTAPGGVCPLHEAPSFLDRIAGVFGKDNDRAPVSGEEVGISLPPSGASLPPPPAPSTSGSRSGEKREQPAAEEPKKKRGFWSRVFGTRDKKEDKERPRQR
jgi:hypothetical protein